jgi:hypothetical protein
VRQTGAAEGAAPEPGGRPRVSLVGVGARDRRVDSPPAGGGALADFVIRIRSRLQRPREGGGALSKSSRPFDRRLDRDIRK